MHALCFRFHLLCSKLESLGHSLCRKQYHDTIQSSKNLETACYPIDNHAGSSNTKISQYLSVNLRTVQRILKDLDESNSNYKYSNLEASLWLFKKRTKFIGGIQAMIDNDPSKLIRCIPRDMGVSEFLIRKVVHEDIETFLIQNKKKTIFIIGHEGKEESLHSKVLELKYSLQLHKLWFFSDEKDFCQDQMVNSQNNCWFAVFQQDA